jgi:long-chain acyl-CoA synthetase
MGSAGYLTDLAQNRKTRVLLDANSGHGYTREELDCRVAIAADALRSPRKALVFLFAANDADSLVAYLSAIESGNAIVLLDAGLESSFKSRLVARFKPDFIIAVEDVLEDIQPLASQYSDCTLPGTGYLLWRSHEPHSFPIHPDLTLLISTSGTTGSPRLVCLSRRNIESNVASINQFLQVSEHDRAMVSAPIAYAFGLSVVNSHLAAGASVVLTRDRVVSPSYWKTVREFQCTSIGGAPYFYQLLDRLDLESLAVKGLKKFTQAGGRLGEELVRKFHCLAEQRGGTFHVMYGQTEATARISGLPPELLPQAARSVGLAIPGGRLSVEHDGRLMGPMKEGELVYEGPNVMMGYASSPSDLGNGDTLGGKLLTGDLGYYDKQGLFYITGRRARFVKVFGFRISLDDVEELLSEAGPLAAVNERDRIIIYCERSPAELSRPLRALSEKLRIHPSGFECRHLERIPRLANGKVDYLSLTPELVAK